MPEKLSGFDPGFMAAVGILKIKEHLDLADKAIHDGLFMVALNHMRVVLKHSADVTAEVAEEGTRAGINSKVKDAMRYLREPGMCCNHPRAAHEDERGNEVPCPCGCPKYNELFRNK